jgi:hypothetical protein
MMRSNYLSDARYATSNRPDCDSRRNLNFFIVALDGHVGIVAQRDHTSHRHDSAICAGMAVDDHSVPFAAQSAAKQ